MCSGDPIQVLVSTSTKRTLDSQMQRSNRHGIVALVTGGNSGVGLTLSERLLSDYGEDGIEICLVCRNKFRAENARKTLLSSHSGARVTIIILDTSSISSVINGAKEIRTRFAHIDLLYLNAGAMLVDRGVNWSRILTEILESETPGQKIIHMFTTGEGILLQKDRITQDGLQQVFATNLFGHFVLVRELESHLGQKSPSRIIWTSSRASLKSSFHINDIQHANGPDPYGSSKFAIDTLSVALNEKLKKQQVFSNAACPGLVLTNLTSAIFPMWIWYLLLPFFLLMRIFVSSFNLNSHNGSESLVWLSKKDPETLDPKFRYESNTSVLGRAYVTTRKMAVDPDICDKLYDQCDQLYQNFKHDHQHDH